jgi:hypothetical protein
MTFGEALEKCKQGARISREGWNGRNQYIEIASDIEYTNFEGTRKKATHLDVGSHCLVFVNPNRGIQMGWLASQSDMLADDWITL